MAKSTTKKTKAEIQEILTGKNIEFSKKATLEELETILSNSQKTEKVSEKSSRGEP